MRIDRLDLIAYGAFTDHLLDLAAPGLHVVYGPNEAGKSTALSSLSPLLYGFDERTPFGFKHGLSKLRVGARLRTPSGEVLDVVRRKGRKNSLQDEAGKPIPEEALAPFLSGISKETFATEFALGGQELREGGELLASGKGDLVQALAATHSGLQLPKLLKTIDERQDELYKRRATKPKINARLAELKAARTRLADASLKPAAYVQAENEVAEARRELDAVTTALEDTRRKHIRLTSFVRILPALSRRRDFQAVIEAVSAEGVCAPGDVVEALPGLRGARPKAVARLDDRKGELEEVERRLGELDIDELLLQHGDAVEDLFQDLKAVQQAIKRRDLSVGEVSRLREAAEALLHEVHPDASLDDVSLFRIPDLIRDRARNLHERHVTAIGLLQQSQTAVKERQDRKEQADKALSELPPSEDVSLLRAAHAAVPADLLSSIESAQDAEGRALHRCAQILHELGLAGLDPESAVQLHLPARQEVEEANGKANELTGEQRDLAKERKKAATQLDELRQELDRVLADDPPPTADELRSARQRRDGILDSSVADPGLAPSAREAVAEADRLADAMFQHSERVTERTRLEADIIRQTGRIVQFDQQLLDLDGNVELHDRQWGELWRHLPAGPPARGAATRLFDRFEQLRNAEEELQDARISRANRQRRAQEHVERLRDLLRVPDADSMVRLGGATVLSELPELMEIADTRIAEHEKTVQKRTVLETRAEDEATELTAALAQRSQYEEELAEVVRKWEGLLQSAALPAGRGTEAGLVDLARLSEVAALVEQADTAERGSQQGDRHIDGFHERLRATADACRITLPGDLTERLLTVEPLHRKLARCRSDEQRRFQLESSQADLETAVAKDAAELNEIDLRLAEFTARTGVSHEGELESAVERARRRSEAQADLRTVNATLPGEKELRDLVRESEGVGSEQLDADLRRLEETIIELEERRSSWTARLTTRQNEFDRLDGSAQAAQAGSEVAMVAAELVDETEEYLRLELARHYITQCLEEYRNKGQDPVLSRASNAFRKLTCDRFTGLELSESDSDRPAILAQSSSGALLSTDRLSEGTRDQLYLALRLASLERHADNGRALPLAVDDIFMTFDDERTAAGLHVLNDLADRFQVIVFTHHEHVAEIATAELPPHRIHLHRLPR